MVDLAGLGGRRMTSSALPQSKAPPSGWSSHFRRRTTTPWHLDCTLLGRFAPSGTCYSAPNICSSQPELRGRGRRPLHCGISTRLMSALGHQRPGDTPTVIAPRLLRPKTGQGGRHRAKSALCQKRTSASQQKTAPLRGARWATGRDCGGSDAKIALALLRHRRDQPLEKAVDGVVVDPAHDRDKVVLGIDIDHIEPVAIVHKGGARRTWALFAISVEEIVDESVG